MAASEQAVAVLASGCCSRPAEKACGLLGPESPPQERRYHDSLWDKESAGKLPKFTNKQEVFIHFCVCFICKMDSLVKMMLRIF